MSSSKLNVGIMVAMVAASSNIVMLPMRELRFRPRLLVAAIAALAILPSTACDDSPTTPETSPGPGTVRIVFQGLTTRRPDLPASALACATAVGATHIHPSWRNFAAIPLQAFPPDRYEIRFDDVPLNARVSFRINDQNSCDLNPTGAVIQDVFANNIRLIQNTTTPGTGDEPGYAFVAVSNGTITQ